MQLLALQIDTNCVNSCAAENTVVYLCLVLPVTHQDSQSVSTVVDFSAKSVTPLAII